jgi:hypothetical protein
MTKSNDKPDPDQSQNPPRREWQGLTDEEIVKMAVESHLAFDIDCRVSPIEFYFGRLIERKLKEKNT